MQTDIFNLFQPVAFPDKMYYILVVAVFMLLTVCPGSSDPPDKIFSIFASENEVYTIYLLLRYFRLNIFQLQSKIILGHMNSIE